MEKDKNAFVELAKYPLLVFSLLLAIVLAKYLLKLEFGVVTEVSTSGVKFAEKNQALYESVVELEGKLNEALKTMEMLQAQLIAPVPPSKEEQAEIFSAAQTVSDQTARFAQIGTPDESGKEKKLRGYVWIGNFDNRTWKSPILAQIESGQPIQKDPGEILPGEQFKLLGNMIVRDGLPSNDGEYFRGRDNIGVLPRGSTIRIMKPPVGINREFAIQYWAEVEIL